MSAEIKRVLSGSYADRPTSSSEQVSRLTALIDQQKDDAHPADSIVAEQIFNCSQCPGKEQAIGELLEARDRLEIKIAGSWDKSGLHKIDARLALCSSCGIIEKPKVLLKSA
jgi:hypothetical protein